MAFDLTATIRMQDKLSAPMRNAEKATKDMQRALDRASGSSATMGSKATAAGLSFARMGSSAAKSLSDIASRAASASAKVAAIGHAVIGVGAAVGIAKLSSNALKLSSDAEQANIAFTTMLGGADKAKSFMADLTKFAGATPFELPGLRDSSKKLLAFGFASEQVLPMLTGVGNAAAGLGLGTDGVDRIALALGQMKAKAKVSGDEMMQLTEAGIPAWQILADKMNISTAAVMKMSEKGLIPADKAIQALIEGMNKKFPDMMDKQSKSLAGLFSTMKDTFNNKLLVQYGDGIASTLKPRFDKLTTWINANGDTIDRWGANISRTAGEASDAIAKKFEGAFRYMKTNVFDKPEFKKLTTLESKVSFAVQSYTDSFNAWYTNGGNTQIASATSNMIGFVSDALSASSDKLAGVGIDLGKAIGGGMLTGLDQFTKDNPKMAALMTFMLTPGSLPVKFAAAAVVGGNAAIRNGVDAASERQTKKESTVSDYIRLIEEKSKTVPDGQPLFGQGTLLPDTRSTMEKRIDDFKSNPFGLNSLKNGFNNLVDGSHAGGLARVPYSGYVSVLHKDETVLTKAEADERRSGGGSGKTPVQLTFHYHGERLGEREIDNILGVFVRKLEVIAP